MIFCAQLSFAQIELESEKPSFKERLYFGGNLGLNFGDIVFIEVSPLVGYMLSNKASVGTGVIYQYLEFRRPSFSTSIYGGRVFGRYNLFESLFAYAEYEALNLQFINRDNQIIREWVPGLLVGGGYFIRFGSRQRSGLNVMVLYNLLHDPLRSPYPSDIIFRVGVAF